MTSILHFDHKGPRHHGGGLSFPSTGDPVLDQATIDYWRNRLNAIDRMLTEVSEQHITITSKPLDLTGIRSSTEPPLPGGERIDITGPWASDAAYGDQPTPRQVIVEWAVRIRNDRGGDNPSTPRYVEALTYLRDHTGWILESPWAAQWTADIDEVHARLRALCPPEVDERHDDTPIPDPIDLDDWFDRIPDDRALTRAETETLKPGALTDADWARLRQAAKRARDDGADIPARHYPVRWIREIAAEACARDENLSQLVPE